MALRGVPRDWDYVVHHPAATNPEAARFEGLGRYYDASRRHFRARIAVGVAGQPPPPYVPHQTLRLELPEVERSRAAAELGGRRSIAVMPSGSGARFLYPSVTAWLLVLDELERRFPDAVFTFVGRVSGGDGRTMSGITRDEVDRLLASRRAALDVFDRPILDAARAVEACELLVSPHTGFAFAGLAVGTPWLDALGWRLARVLLQRRPVPLRPSEEQGAPDVRSRSDDASDRGGRGRRRAASAGDEPSARAGGSRGAR